MMMRPTNVTLTIMFALGLLIGEMSLELVDSLHDSPQRSVWVDPFDYTPTVHPLRVVGFQLLTAVLACMLSKLPCESKAGERTFATYLGEAI